MVELAGSFLGEDVYWIPGYKGLYAISMSGKIASFKTGRGMRCKGWKKTGIRSNYEHVGLCISGKERNGHLVHRLMACTFLGLDLSDNSTPVDHLDNNKLHNHLDNLEVCSTSLNNMRKSGFGDKDTSTHKECRHCRELKSREQFYKCSRSSDGIDSYCNSCATKVRS